MRAHRVETTVQESGTVALKDLPFGAGERVEVIVLAPDAKLSTDDRYPLRGKCPYQYDRPMEPAVAPEEWEANQ